MKTLLSYKKKTNFGQTLLFVWLLILSAFIPLYPKFPLINVKGTYVAIRLEDFLIAIAIFWWLVVTLPKLKSFLSQTLTKSILLFWVIGLLSLFSGIFLTLTTVPHLGFLHYLRRIEVMALFFVAASAIRSAKQVKIWLLVMLFTTIGVVLYGFGQQYLHFPVISTTNREFSKGLILFLSPEARVNSTFAGHYDLAAYLAFFLTMLTALFFSLKKLFHKLAFFLVGLLGFLLLALTAARVSFLAVLLGMASVFLLSGRKKLILALVGVGLLALLISPDLRHRTVATLTVNFLGGGGAKYVPPAQMPGVTNKFSVENAATGAATPAAVPVDIVPGEPLNTTELGVERSFQIRFREEWPRAVQAFFKNPFLGTGYSSLTIATDNDYLRSLGEVGFLGTGALVLTFFVIFKKMWKIRSPLIIGLLSGLLTVFLTAAFIDVLESSKISQLLWISLGVGWGAINLKTYEN